MLKLEKKTRSSEVSVSIKEHSRLITSPFLIAFGIALAIHFIGFLLFQIAPFSFGNLENIFPPVQVNIDYIPLIDGGVLAELENQPLRMDPIPEPEILKPTFPQMRQTPTMKKVAYPKITKIPHFPFELAEKLYSPVDLLDHQHSTPYQKNPVTVYVNGELEGRNYSLKRVKEMIHTNPHNGTSEKALEIKNDKETRVVSYRIKVENKTGRVFWIQPITSPQGKRIHRWAQKIVEGMKFDPIPGEFVSEGEVEFEFIVDIKEGLQ